jgi:pimeloyl-ACP methyl ester carboxylesterase
MRNEIDGSPRIMTLRGFNDETLLPSSVLTQVTAPTCFIWGEQDPFGGRELARTFAGRFPDARLELMPNAGHAPWIDDPDHVARRVDEFLRT